MNIAAYSIRHRVVSWLFTLVLLVGGIVSFTRLGQLEDPEFTIKTAMVITSYPGASPRQVEEEVTLPVEMAIQNLPYVDYVTSISSNGLSQVQVEMKPNGDLVLKPKVAGGKLYLGGDPADGGVFSPVMTAAGASPAGARSSASSAASPASSPSKARIAAA